MEWPRVPLEHVALVNPKDKELLSLPDDTLVSFVPMRSVSEVTAGITTQFVRPLSEVRRGYTVFKNRDILFAKITPCMENGKCALATGLTNGLGFGSTEFHVLRAGPNLLPEFLRYFVRSKSFRIAAKQHMRGGAGQQRVPDDFVRKEPMPLPSLVDQRRIVEILDQADRIRRLRAKAHDHANRIIPALFVKMFGDPITNPMGWDSKPFSDILVEPLRNGVSPSSSGTFRAKVLTLSAITGRAFDETAVKDRYFRDQPVANKEIDLRDFLVCRGNGNLGLVGRARFPRRKLDKTLFPDTVIAARIDPDQADKSYLEALWHTSWMRLQLESRSTTTSGIYKINQTTLGSIPVRLPPMNLQTKFGVLSNSLTRSMEEQQTNKLDRLFEVLNHSAFLGGLSP